MKIFFKNTYKYRHEFYINKRFKDFKGLQIKEKKIIKRYMKKKERKKKRRNK